MLPHLQAQPWKRLRHLVASQAQNFSQKFALPEQGQSTLHSPTQVQGWNWGHICRQGRRSPGALRGVHVHTRQAVVQTRAV